MNQQPGVNPVSRVLLSELKRCFRKFTDSGDAHHEPLFLMATALDPRYRLVFNPNQVDGAKAAILKQVCASKLNNVIFGILLRGLFFIAHTHTHTDQ